MKERVQNIIVTALVLVAAVLSMLIVLSKTFAFS
jgi:hypothetical protein